MEKIDLMKTDTVAFDKEHNAVVIIDQTKLPNQIELISLTTGKEIWEAIYLLKVRGAPAIGVAAAFGIVVLANQMTKTSIEGFLQEFEEAKDYLNSARPTAVNLSWALERMYQCVLANQTKSIPDILEELYREAIEIRDEDIRVCRAIGEYGVKLLPKTAGVLTHCNAGKLATIMYGTATAPMYLAKEKGYQWKVFCDETRPLLQGARLTAFELQESGIDTTLICDNMSGRVMKNGWIDAIFVGCDRVAANGDVANKIGTSVVAAVAKEYQIPVYVCAPTSTIDMATATGDDIMIEERPEEEVTSMWYEKPMAPKGVKVYNPAFDVTSNHLIAGIITEYGVARAPYEKSLKDIMLKKEKNFGGKENE